MRNCSLGLECLQFSSSARQEHLLGVICFMPYKHDVPVAAVTQLMLNTLPGYTWQILVHFVDRFITEMYAVQKKACKALFEGIF